MPADLEVQPRIRAIAIGRPAGISWRLIGVVAVVAALFLHERYQPTLSLHAGSTRSTSGCPTPVCSRSRLLPRSQV